jgi:hypothetical protein
VVSTETAVAAISACAAVPALALAVLAAQAVRRRSDRRFEAVLERLDGDDAAGVLDRAEPALQRASLAGSGTVVVELARTRHGTDMSAYRALQAMAASP